MTDSPLDFDRIQEIPDGSLVVFRFHDPEVDDLGESVRAALDDLRVLLNNRAICAETGHSTSTVHTALGVLRERGAVGFEDGRQGTIHPTVYPVAAG